jgi:hypothetical protein
MVIAALNVTATAIYKRAFGSGSLSHGNFLQAIARLLYCAIHARAAARASVPADIVQSIQDAKLAISNEDSIFDTVEVDAAALDAALFRINPGYRQQIASELLDITPLSAIRLRAAYLFALKTDEDRLQLVTILPGFAALETPSLSLITLSNEIEGLQHATVHTARTEMVGTAKPTDLRMAGIVLRYYTDARLAKQPSDVSLLPYRLPAADIEKKGGTQQQGRDQELAVVHIPRLVVFDNLALFHIPSKAVRTQQGRQLLRRLGAEPLAVGKAPGFFKLPAAELDFLDYQTMKRAAGQHGVEEWHNREIALAPPVFDNTYNSNITRRVHGIEML